MRSHCNSVKCFKLTRNLAKSADFSQKEVISDQEGEISSGNGDMQAACLIREIPIIDKDYKLAQLSAFASIDFEAFESMIEKVSQNFTCMYCLASHWEVEVLSDAGFLEAD